MRQLEGGHWVSCHWAEDIGAGAILHCEVEPMLEGPVAPAVSEPPMA